MNSTRIRTPENGLLLPRRYSYIIIYSAEIYQLHLSANNPYTVLHAHSLLSQQGLIRFLFGHFSRFSSPHNDKRISYVLIDDMDRVFPIVTILTLPKLICLYQMKLHSLLLLHECMLTEVFKSKNLIGNIVNIKCFFGNKFPLYTTCKPSGLLVYNKKIISDL